MNYLNYFFSGIKWTSLNSAIGIALVVIQNIVLANLLKPDSFGLMAEALILIGLMLIIIPAGFIEAIIQAEEVSEDQLSSLFWLICLIALFALLMVYAMAPYLEQYFQTENLSFWVRVLSCGFITIPFGSISQALLSRNLQFGLLNKIGIISSFSAALISILSGFYFKDETALVLGFLSLLIISNALYFFASRPCIKSIKKFNLPLIKNLVSFGLFKTSSSVLGFASVNIDKLLIGYFLGARFLGLYYLAWNIVLLPVRKINPIFNNVLFPIYSKSKNNLSLWNTYYRNNLLVILLLAVPSLCILSYNAPQIIPIIFGEEWSGAITTISILAFVGIVRAFGNPGGVLLLAKGRADILFYWNLFWSISLGVTTWWTLNKYATIEGVAIVQLILSVILSVVFHFLVNRCCQVSYKEIIHYLVKFSLIGLITYIVNIVMPTDQGLFYFLLSILLQLLVGLILILVFFKTEVNRILKLINKNRYRLIKSKNIFQ